VRYFDVLTDLVQRQLPWRVTKLRDQHHLTMTQLAAKTGLARPTISLLEHGKFKGLQFRTVVALAGFFEVGLDYMAGVEHAGLVRAIAILGHPCPECGKQDAHSLPQCALEMFERGRTHAYIAATHQLTLVMVEVIIREQIKSLSLGAGRTS
jgi:transcriptional regulator with XRE-family HTH domain